MKKTKILLFMLIMLLLIFLSCSKDSTGPGNAKPGIPSNPNPADNTTLVSTNTTLSWECTDPEEDPLTYDIYFGTSLTPPLVNTGQSETTYDPGALDVETTYYWMIKANDDHTNSSIGPVWQFTTYDIEWCTIPAGDFTYGNPYVIQNLSYDFQIMKFEVTNQQYVDYMVNALIAGNITVTSNTVEGYYEGDQNYGVGTYEFLYLGALEGRIDWDGSSFSISSGYEDHPVVFVTWFGSWAFAEHYGFRLPTEQEWEKAARGDTGYDYPWGNSIDGSRANYENSGDPFEDGWLETTPVGMYNGQTIQGFSTTDSPSPFEVYDLAGNVREWVNSWHISYRVFSGGSWCDESYRLCSWYNDFTSPSNHFISIGFRCVIS